MITSVGEYLFVTGDDIDTSHPHGDMDRIIINGEIMPLRTGNTASGMPFAKVLRGEDVVFLAEALAERFNFCGQTPSSTSLLFYRSLGLTMDSVVGDIYDSMGYLYFVDSVPSAIYDAGSTGVTDWLADHAYDDSDIDVAEDAFEAGKPLVQANMAGMFSTIRKFSTLFDSRVSVGVASAYQEFQSIDSDYPYQPTGVAGYHSWGGRSVTDSEGNVHPNAYGGWEINFTQNGYAEASGTSEMLTVPEKVEQFLFEQYSRTHSGGTGSSKYQFVKIGDCTVSSGHASITDSHASQRARLLDAMSRYWSITPGFLSTGENDDVTIVRADPYNFLSVGAHTKWW